MSDFIQLTLHSWEPGQDGTVSTEVAECDDEREERHGQSIYNNKEMDTATGEGMKEEIESRGKGVKDKFAELGRQALETIDAQREPAASTLGKTATSLHEQSEKASSVAHSTADKLQATADYVRENDVKAMMEDVEHLVKRYPRQALVAAAAVGFLIGRLFHRND